MFPLGMVDRPGRRRDFGISAWITRAVLQELESRGIDAEPLLSRTRLDRRKLMEPDAWVPHTRHRAFYRAAIQASRDPAFAVGVGRRVPVHLTRVAGYCAARSKDLKEAYETFGRYAQLVVDGSKLGTRRAAGYDAVFAHRPESAPLFEDGPSFAVSVLGFFAHATGMPVRPLSILLAGPTPAGSEEIVAALGAPTTWGADAFEIRFPPGTLDTPVNHHDPALREALEEIARRELAMRAGGSAIARVRAAILQFGFDRSAAIRQVAARLGTTPRTLQRWLAKESRTYSEVREEVLREAALSMFATEGGPVDEIALRLGFSSRSGFHRALERWTGKTPGGLGAKPRGRPEG